MTPTENLLASESIEFLFYSRKRLSDRLVDHYHFFMGTRLVLSIQLTKALQVRISLRTSDASQADETRRLQCLITASLGQSQRGTIVSPFRNRRFHMINVSCNPFRSGGNVRDKDQLVVI
jgi:hypothetical protein